MADREWVIESGYGYTACRLIRETPQFYVTADRYRKGSECRTAKSRFLNWRGTEDDARLICEKLKSAVAERERRKRAASDWFLARKAEILDER